MVSFFNLPSQTKTSGVESLLQQPNVRKYLMTEKGTK
jgi:hypothetical protein